MKNSIGYTTNKLRALSQEAVRNYSGALVDLIVFTLGIINNSFDTWKRSTYNKEIEDAGFSFIGAIAAGTEQDLKDTLQSLILAIFNQKRTGTADKYSSLVYSFLVLYSFCKEGHLNRCNTFTQYFSRIIWFGRISIYNAIKEQARKTGSGFFEYILPSSSCRMLCMPNRCNSLLKDYQPLLLLQSDYPLSSLYHTKNLAKKVSEDQDLGHKVSLSADKSTAVLGSISVHITSFGIMYRGLVAEIEQKQSELFAGITFEDPEWFALTIPDIVSDDNNEIQPGYFFPNHESNHHLLRYEDLGLKILFEHPRLKGRYGCVRSSDQKVILNTVACQDFLRRASEIQSKLASACHISLGGPPRGTEFATNYLRNHPGGDVRHVRFIYSTLCFVSGYNKSSLTVSMFQSLIWIYNELTSGIE